MIKNIFSVILTLFVAFSYMGCDKIEGEYRENADELLSTVVLFEFTGIRCPNCPDAHIKVEELKTQFGKNLKSIAIHSNAFGDPIGSFLLQTQEGNELLSYLEVNGLPQGSVNSIKKGSTTEMGDWGSNIGKYGYKSPDLELNIEHSLNDTSIMVTINGKFDENMIGIYDDLQIGVYLVESKIEGGQYNGTTLIPDYIHNHVLRSSFNGFLGEEYVKNATAGMEVDELKYYLTLKSNWNKENIEPFVFVYKNENKELIPFKVNYN
ncbi:MAG: Omp28-related outer membrane protein [Salinivirgaceae bacterium]|nr:Omp28-related outer membrane protein [Salinivirgaceae bacterium]